MPALYVGRTTFSLSGFPNSRSTLALPAGTEVGDAILVSLIGGFNQPGVCTDPRVSPLITAALGTRGAGAWVGYADTLDPLTISIATANSGIGQFCMGAVWVWRNRKWDLTRSVRTPALGGATTGAVPAVPNTGTGVIAVGQAQGGLGGINTTWPAAGPYSRFQVVSASYVLTDLGQSLLREVPASPDPALNRSDPADPFRVVTVGFNDDELFPVRLYPRDDEGGLGSGRRLYPPPKRVRRVGGIQ